MTTASRAIEGLYSAHLARARLTELAADIAQGIPPLNARRVFFRSWWEFNRHIAGGIAVLAGRLADDLLDDATGSGLQTAARILDPAVDEFGLEARKPVDHHELFFEFAEGCGVQREELRREVAVEAAVALGAFMRWSYWTAELPESLGAHAISELTSQDEFIGPLGVLSQQFSQDGSAADYIVVHTTIETRHVQAAGLALDDYLRIKGLPPDRAVEAARGYLEQYKRMLDQLSIAIRGRARGHYN